MIITAGRPYRNSATHSLGRDFRHAQVVRPKDGYRLVAELHAEGVRTGRACHALGVSRSGYYAWAARAPSPRAIRQAWLTDLIGTIHQASRGTYGAPRVHAELIYGHGITIGHNTVSLLMRRSGLAGLPTPSRGKRSRKLATVTDLVRRDFRRSGPNQLWVTDITEHPTREGKVYCCVVLDAWSRRVVGWAIDSRQRADLATNALGMAIDSRAPAAGGIIHGDHGTQGVHWLNPPSIRRGLSGNGSATPGCSVPWEPSATAMTMR